MAPQTDEFGHEGRPARRPRGHLRRAAARRSARAAAVIARRRPARFASELAVGPSPALAAAGLRVGLIALAVVVVGGGIVAAGTPARGIAVGKRGRAPRPHCRRPWTRPRCRRSRSSQDVIDFDHELAGTGMEAVVVTLARNLELENQALLRRRRRDPRRRRPRRPAGRDAGTAADGRPSAGRRSSPTTSSTRSTSRSSSRSAQQAGLSLGLAGRGTMTEETTDADGSRDRVASRRPFDLTFAMRRATGERWMNVAVLPGWPLTAWRAHGAVSCARAWRSRPKWLAGLDVRSQRLTSEGPLGAVTVDDSARLSRHERSRRRLAPRRGSARRPSCVMAATTSARASLERLSRPCASVRADPRRSASPASC